MASLCGGCPFAICTSVCKPPVTGIACASRYPRVDTPLHTQCFWTCVGMLECGTPEGVSRDLRPPALLTPDWSEWRQLQPVMWPSHHQREGTHIPPTQRTHSWVRSSLNWFYFHTILATFWLFCWATKGIKPGSMKAGVKVTGIPRILW